MKLTGHTYLFLAAFVALIMLLVFQVNWLVDSKAMIEAQFDQELQYVLRRVINDINAEHNYELIQEQSFECPEPCKSILVTSSDLTFSIADQIQIHETLDCALASFNIDKGYTINFIEHLDGFIPNSLALSPHISLKNQQSNFAIISIQYAEKTSYVSSRLKYLSMSSMFILLFVSLTFVLIWRALVQQKQITDSNIDFFNNTAHELKTPLTNIRLATRLMLRSRPELESDRYIGIVRHEEKKLMEQIDKVLYLSKMENGEYELERQELNLKTLIMNVIGEMDIMLESRGAIIALHAPDSNYLVQGDKYHLSNVFRNLIDNALKYCKGVPKIQINIRCESEGIYLNFKDNGIGISKTDQEHIFKKFQRVGTGDIHNQKGFGIGLSYARTVIEMHKGFIKILSDLNKGSQFDLFLPHH